MSRKNKMDDEGMLDIRRKEVRLRALKNAIMCEDTKAFVRCLM